MIGHSMIPIAACMVIVTTLLQKRKSDTPIPILLPLNMDTEGFMRLFSFSHGYKWLVVQEYPVLVAFGRRKYDYLPDMLLVNKTVLIQREDNSHLERMKHTLDVISNVRGKSN
jgi:hypothetical protein